MTSRPDRRTVVTGLGALLGGFQSAASEAQPMNSSAELILYNGKITTLDRQNPEAEAVAMRDGRFVAVGSEREVIASAAPDAKRIDLRGRRVIPG
jgi:imidazolonepropionase-like amidohydrolase